MASRVELTQDVNRHRHSYDIIFGYNTDHHTCSLNLLGRGAKGGGVKVFDVYIVCIMKIGQVLNSDPIILSRTERPPPSAFEIVAMALEK